MTTLLTDPETGRLVAFSGGPVPVLEVTLDDPHLDFERMLDRRAREITNAPKKVSPPMTYARRAELERAPGWESVEVAEERHRAEVRVGVLSASRTERSRTSSNGGWGKRGRSAAGSGQ
jgi:hypothetical protein